MTAQAMEHDIWCVETAFREEGTAACYLLRGGDDYALVDCGTGLSVQPILETLGRLGVARTAVRLILPTHVHLDHAGGAGGLLAALPSARLYAHPRGLPHLRDPGRLLAGARAVYGEEAFLRENGEILAVDPERSDPAPDGLRLLLGDRELLLIDAPGHARHHLAIWDARSRGFFTGDVFGLAYPQLAAGGRPFIVPTTTPVQFDPRAWMDSLDRMMGFAPESMYLAHYGRVCGVTTLAAELRLRIQEHAALGQQYAQEGEVRLAERLAEALLVHYRRQGGQLDAAAFRAVLAMDLTLNAQGLCVWQQH